MCETLAQRNERLLRQAGVHIEPQGKAYLLIGTHRSMCLESLVHLKRNDIALLTGQRRIVMR